MNDLIRMDDGLAVLDGDAEVMLAELEEKLKALKEVEDEIKKKIITEMEEKGIIKVETERITITYLASTDRESFDSKQFRADNPDLFDSYVKMTPVKASVRLKLK